MNILDCYVWNAVGQLIRWDKIQNYQSLQQEIQRAIRLVPVTGVALSDDVFGLWNKVELVLRNDLIKNRQFPLPYFLDPSGGKQTNVSSYGLSDMKI